MQQLDDLKVRTKKIRGLKGAAKHLRKLGSIELKAMHPGLGICFEVQRLVSYQNTVFIVRLMGKWPKATGTAGYPVPHPELSPPHAFLSVNLWAADEYGDNRRELCLWLADEIEAQLCSN